MLFRHSKSYFFLHGQNFNFEILPKKKCTNHTRNHIICVNHEEKSVKEVKIHDFLFAHSNLKTLRKVRNILHNRETVTFRNSSAVINFNAARFTWRFKLAIPLTSRVLTLFKSVNVGTLNSVKFSFLTDFLYILLCKLIQNQER